MRTALARRLSLDFMDPLFKRDVLDKIDRLNENGTFPGIEHYVPVAAETVSFLEYLDPAEWMFALIEPDQITTNVAKFESLLRNEYDAAAEKGRAVYPPEKLTTEGSEVLGFLREARLAFSEVHVGKPARAGETPAVPGEEYRLRAPQVDRYTNRLPEFTTDVKRGHGEGRRQIFFAATKGGREKVERLLKEFDVPFVAESDALQAEIVIASGVLPRGFDFEERRREEARLRRLRHRSARPQGRRLHRPRRSRRGAIPWLAAHPVRTDRARGDGDRVLRRRQAADADGEPQSHPEVLRRRGHAAKARPPGRHGLGAHEGLGQEGDARHGGRAAEALRHAADGAGARLLEGFAVAV